MVAARVILTVLEGTHSGQRFELGGQAPWVIGRSSDCNVHLAGGFEDWLVSRHHCQVDVEAPAVLVHDLGSRNGTFLNGRRIPNPTSVIAGDHDTEIIPPEFELKDGDELRVGPIPLRVHIEGTP
jgi:pSer/pThr/pTyr-binding forkhead associated (FHA) protein